MRVRAIDGGDPRDVAAAVAAALDGRGPVLGLGLAREPSADTADALPPGTAALIATSGSSGVPKTVVLSAAALRASATATAARIGAGSWLLALPAAYVAGLQVLVRAELAGTRPVYLAGRFTPETFAAAAGEMPPGSRYTSLVPAQLATLVEAAEVDAGVRGAVRSFDRILVGGQALPVVLCERARNVGARIVRTYGSSETSGGCVYDGVPLDGVDVRVVAGELVIAGPTLADGYLGDEALTAAAFPVDPDGTRRYRTGDAGSVVDGVVRVEGRLDNVIVSGGVNVSLDRVEAVVRGIAGLGRAVVLGVDDERWGEASVVVVPPGGTTDAAALLAAARAAVADAIGPAARPSRIEVLPVTYLASGKPDRRALRAALDRP